MSHPLLVRFTGHVVHALLRTDQLELVSGREQAVVEHVAHRLARVRTGSLISSLSDALLSSDDVVELYADDDALKAVVDDLDPSAARH